MGNSLSEILLHDFHQEITEWRWDCNIVMSRSYFEDMIKNIKELEAELETYAGISKGM
jgi:hypothetical protein